MKQATTPQPLSAPDSAPNPRTGTMPPVFADATADNIVQRIQARAYELYEQRSGQDGQAEEDWYQAEREVLSEIEGATA